MEVLQVKPQNLTSSTSQLPFMRFPGVKPFFCNAFSSAIPPTKRGCAFRVIAHLKATTAAAEVARLKENWLDSLTCPLPALVEEEEEAVSSTDSGADSSTASGSNWIVGIDPDLSGAIALLKTEESICSAQGWWSGGFGYGLWIGILVASGYSVVPVPSLTWKNKFRLTGENATKDESRRLASTLFPSLSSSLTRKKDHGRAEALLIAAYGKGMMMNSTVTCNVEELPQDDDD
ncbi:Holliday junction resolvase MOC1, chloroplastic [Linum perenne]